MKVWILFLISVAVMIIANLPFATKAFFPLNLPFCFIGGVGTGWFGLELLKKKIGKKQGE